MGARKAALLEQYFFECSCTHCDGTQKVSVLSPEEDDQRRELVKQVGFYYLGVHYFLISHRFIIPSFQNLRIFNLLQLLSFEIVL